MPKPLRSSERDQRITFEHRTGDRLKGFEWQHLGGLWVKATPQADGVVRFDALHTPVFDALLPNLRLRWGEKVLAIKSCQRAGQMMVIEAVETTEEK